MEENRYEITLDVSSGLPNPCWTLTGAAAAELSRRLAALPAAPPARAATPPILGYRGLRVTASGGGLTWHLYRGAVRHGDAVHADPDRAVERWLLGTAGSGVSAAFLEAARQDLDGGS